MVTWGSPEARFTTLGLITLFWLALGIPLSWRKGACYPALVPYRWIGVMFCVVRAGVTRIYLPRDFVDDLLTLCRDFLGTARLPLAKADALIGKAGRVVFVLPQVRPFVWSLYAALSGALEGEAAGAHETAPGMVACKRFRHGSRWLLRILSFQDRGTPVPSSRLILAEPPPAPDPSGRHIKVDASPWGAGAVLYDGRRPQRCFSYEWQPEDFRNMKVAIGSCASQTFFEVLALVMAIELWCRGPEPTAILGDNQGALQEALDLKGRALHELPSQVLALLRCSRSLVLSVGHLPTEANWAADALSRLFGPAKERKEWPFAPIGQTSIRIDQPMRPLDLWRLLL